MGLANAPATFQRLIDNILGALEPWVLVYLDDIVLISGTFEKHIEILIEVFRRRKAANLTVAKEKCQFCRPHLKMHVVPDTIRAILDIPTPKCVKDLRRIIGSVSPVCAKYFKFDRTLNKLT